MFDSLRFVIEHGIPSRDIRVFLCVRSLLGCGRFVSESKQENQEYKHSQKECLIENKHTEKNRLRDPFMASKSQVMHLQTHSNSLQHRLRGFPYLFLLSSRFT